MRLHESAQRLEVLQVGQLVVSDFLDREAPLWTCAGNLPRLELCPDDDDVCALAERWHREPLRLARGDGWGQLQKDEP